MTGKAVKLGGYQWKVEQRNVRKWKLWVRFHLTMIIFHFVSMKYIIPAGKACPSSTDGCHYQLLGCIFNCSLRWSAIFHTVTLQIFDQRFFLLQILPCSKILHILLKKYGQNLSGTWNYFNCNLHRKVDLNLKKKCFMLILNLIVSSDSIYIKETTRFTIQISKDF